MAVAVVISLSAGLVRATDEPDELARGTSALIRTGTLARFTARPPDTLIFDLPDIPANDPTAQGGTLQIFDTLDPSQEETYNLPAPGWKALGNPPGSRGFRYQGAGTLGDPCTVVRVNGHVAKATCKGAAIGLTPPFIGDVAVMLTIGTSSKRYCAFGEAGYLAANANGANTSAKLVRRRVPPPTACVTPAKLCIPLTQWGTAGSEDGQLGIQFLSPTGLAADGAGNVYVAEGSNCRVEKFDGSGAFLTKWGTCGTGDGQFGADGPTDGPQGVATDTSGNVYVADLVNTRVQKFDSSGNFLMKWSTGLFPYAIALDASGNVYVVGLSFTGDHVEKYDGAGNLLTSWGPSGGGDGLFGAYAFGVATDASGNVYVGDPYHNRVQKFDGSGTFLTKWGTPGNGDGQFRLLGPRGLASDASGNVYVGDPGNFRIQKFDGNGTFLTKWSTAAGLQGLLLPATDASGNVYVANSGGPRIQKFFGCP
jgi:hypothetical protein